MVLLVLQCYFNQQVAYLVIWIIKFKEIRLKQIYFKGRDLQFF